MSYEFWLYDPANVPALADLHSFYLRSVECRNANPSVPALEARKRELARAMVALDPDLRDFQIDFPTYATDHSISLAQAQERFRQIHVNGSGAARGLCVVLYDDTAEITLDLLAPQASMGNLMELAWRCACTANRIAGYQCYDPEAKSVQELSAKDLRRMIQAYRNKAGRLNQIAANADDFIRQVDRLINRSAQSKRKR